MQHLPFRWIETFRIVASAGSMTDAAQILSLDQSAMSRHISALEGHLNLTLFDRTKRRLRLTPEGQELLPEAEDAAGAVARFERKAEALRRKNLGHLTLLTSATIARGLIPLALKEFKQKASDVAVTMEVVGRRELERRIEGQQFDLCAVALPFSYPADCQIRLGTLSGVCVLPSHHKLAKQDSIEINDLADEILVGLPRGTVGRMRIEQLFTEKNLTYRPQYETTAAALNEFVEQGVGISICDPLTALAMNSNKTVFRPLNPKLSYDFALFFPTNRPKNKLASLFADATLASIAGLS